MTIRALSPADLRLARLAAGGRSDREVAQVLGVTLDAVERHLSSITRKLGARSRPELIAVLADTIAASQLDGRAPIPSDASRLMRTPT